MTSRGAREVLESIEAARKPLRDAAKRLGFDGLEQETPAGWTAKEMLSHVAFWEEGPIGFITLAVRRQSMPDGWRFGSGYFPDLNAPWPRSDDHNAREAAWGRSQAPEQVLARWDKAHEELVTFLASVSDQEVGDRPDYFRGIWEHFTEHLPELQSLLDREESA